MSHCVARLKSLQRAKEVTGKREASVAMGTPGYRKYQDQGMSIKDNKKCRMKSVSVYKARCEYNRVVELER